MSLHVFDPTAFRAQFTAFANATTYPDATLQTYWDMSACIIEPYDNFAMCGNPLQLALNLLTAHQAQLFTTIAAGNVPGVLTGASEGTVSVSMQPPPTKDGFTWWLSTTPYGAQLRALLIARSAGGFYIGGRPETSAFRKVGGRF